MSRCGERRRRRNGVDCSGPRFDGGDPSLRSSSCSLRAPRRPSWDSARPEPFRRLSSSLPTRAKSGSRSFGTRKRVPHDPSELLRQADALARSAGATQADLRRAISTAYYVVFHFCLSAAADMVCGIASRSTARYSLVYRSVDHKTLKRTVRPAQPDKIAKRGDHACRWPRQRRRLRPSDCQSAASKKFG
jgi:hypothetical protein